MTTTRTTATVAILLAATAAGCDDPTTPGDPSRVQVAFTTAPAAAGAPPMAASVAVEGSNGTLELDEVYLVVTEFELKRVSDDDCAEEDDACEKFEAPPTFVEIPLEGGRTVAVSSLVPPDVYDEFELEVDDLEDDDDDEDDRAEAQLLAQIRARFADWPRDASMLVVGTFTPTGGAPQPFRVYFEAEVEVELDLAPPVVIGEGEDGTFTIELDPARWFVDGTGRVRNLALLDFDATGRVAELEVEIENGFVGVEFDD